MAAPLDGRLHVYDPSKNLTCFESGSTSATNCLVFFGGLGAGLASMPVLHRLSGALGPSWSLVQVLTRSSYQGSLTTALDDTVEDMKDLEVYFRDRGGKTGRLVFMGASIGCNNVIRFLDLHGAHTTVDSGILISLNCGVEALLQHFTVEELDKSLAIAASQIESGYGAYPFPPDVVDQNKILQVCKDMHANVWHAILRPGGPAGNFKSTASEEELMKTFAGIRSARKSLHILMAGSDEAIPDSINKRELLKRLIGAAQGDVSVASGKVVEGANHNMQQESAQAIVVESVLQFLEQSNRG